MLSKGLKMSEDAGLLLGTEVGHHDKKIILNPNSKNTQNGHIMVIDSSGVKRSANLVT